LLPLLILGTLCLAALVAHGQAGRPRTFAGPPSLPIIVETPTYTFFLPLIQIEPAPTSTPVAACERYRDPRLDQRGATFVPATVTPGAGYWCLVRAVWYNSEESQGRRNIFVDLLDSEGNRPVGLPVRVSWPDGEHTIITQAKPGEEYAADFPMQSLAPAYRAQPNTGDPADAIDGMGLGEIDDPIHAHHTSYGLVWQWMVAPADPPPTATVTATLPVTVSPTITTPPVGTDTPAPTVTFTVTHVITLTPLPTESATPVVTPLPSPTGSMPFARAEVAGCEAGNAGTRFSGTLSVAGQPADGYRVVFRFGEGYGDWATNPVSSGPNPPGFYTHIISAGFASEGLWSTWLVDEAGTPISPYAPFATDGTGGACNWVTVNFYDE
jgi:hypothetical protein